MMSTMARETSKEVIYVSTDRIKPNPNQPRKFFTKESLDELSKSILEHGILQPLSVRFIDDTYELIAGERRFRASKLANQKFVPCIVINIDDEKSSVLALLENIQREDLNFIEEALAYEKLIKEYGYTQQELATKLGKNQSTIANKLRILKLDDLVKIKIVENNLTERHARALLKVSDNCSQNQLLDKIIENNLNVNKAEKLIDNYLEPPIMKKKSKYKIVIKDIKIFFNTINHAVDIMQKSGINANQDIKKTDDGYQIVVNIKS